MKLRKSMLSASIATALLFAAAAQAQNASPQNQTTSGDQQQTTTSTRQQATSSQPAASQDPSQTQQLQTIEVVGIRASLWKSLQLKRASDAIVDAVTAEDVGKFPNTNVAEAMTQIPGVTIDRNMGQGDLVSIDGVDPSLNLTFLNGHLVAQVPWLIGANPSRGFDFTILPPQIIGNVEVYKSSQAKLPEGSIGGTVIVHTREPLDLDANSFAGSIGFTYNDQAEEFKPNASLLYSWKNPASTFGVAVSASHYEEQINRQGIEIFSYGSASQYVNAPGAASSNAQVPQEVNSAFFQQTRKRNGLTLALQAKPNDQLDFGLHAMYLKENYSNWNQSLYPIPAFTPKNVDSLGPESAGVISSGHVCSNVFSAPCTNAAAATGRADSLFDSNPRISKVTIKGIDLNGKYHGDHWGVSAQAGISKSQDPENTMYSIEANYMGGYSFNRDTGISYDDSAAARDPANWYVGGLNGSGGSSVLIQSLNAKLGYAQVDFFNDFDSVFNRLEYGVRYNQAKTEKITHSYNGAGPGLQGTFASLGLFGGYVDTLNNFPAFSTDQGHHIQPDKDAEINYIRGLTLTEVPNGYINGTYKVDEMTSAAYIQQDFATDNLHGNIGVRYVHTSLSSGGYVPDGVPVLPAPASWWHTTKSSYDMWLPSFNIAYDASETLTLRAAVAKTMARAPVNQFAPSVSLNDNNMPPTGTGGNANLAPYEAYNFNVSAEWYFAPQSLLAISGFYKKISNYVVTEPVLERHFNQLFVTTPDQYAALVAAGYCEKTTGYCQYSIQRPINKGAGKIRGFSVSYQQPFGDTGFGLVASATYSNGTSDGGGPLPYNSKYSVNFSPYYEKGPFSARVTYGWRSTYFASGYVAGAPPAYTNDYNQLDATLGWAFNDHFAVTVSALNITNQQYFTYFGTKAMPANRYYNGRRYLGTLNFKF